MKRTGPLLAALAVGSATAAVASPARALDPEVTSDTAAQFYDVRSPGGETILARRRLTTTLGVSAYDLLGHEHEQEKLGQPIPELTFRARLRYDADYGATPGTADPRAFDSYVPGFSRGPVDLMYAYVEGRKLAGGWLGFRLGRQYVTDVLGWWSFDGGQVRVTTPFFVAIEAYGGLEQRGGFPLSSSRYERDGVWRGRGTDLDPSLYPAYEPRDVAPAFGAAVETAGFTQLHGRLTYRRVYNTGESNLSEFAPGLVGNKTYDGTRISQERIGYSLDGSLPDVGGVKGGIAYDFYAAKVSTIYGSVDGYVSKKVTLSVDYDYYAPTYDADSIWSFFAGSPLNDVAGRANWDISDQMALSGQAHVRVFQQQTSGYSDTASPNLQTDRNYYPSAGATFDEGAYLQIRQRVGENANALRMFGDVSGKQGDRVGGDLYLERLIENRYIFEGRGSIWHWNDKIRADRDATSYGVVAGVGYKLAPRSKILFEYQLDANRLVGFRNRAMIWLTVAVAK